jgi:prepilin-type N-terminal cleavage/methylation domain-containing protein
MSPAPSMTPDRRWRRGGTRPHGSGFTLVETIATMAVLAVVGSIASMLVFNASRSFTDASRTAQLQTELSGAMERATRELRWIGINPDSAPVVPLISSVTATSITWNTSYSLSLVSGELRYVENGAPAIVLLKDVSAMTISTFDESNAALAATLSGSACHPVRRVQVAITITRGGATQTLRSRVFLRSLMEGA